MTLRKNALTTAFVGTGISSPFRVFCEGSPSRTKDRFRRFFAAMSAPIVP